MECVLCYGKSENSNQYYLKLFTPRFSRHRVIRYVFEVLVKYNTVLCTLLQVFLKLGISAFLELTHSICWSDFGAECSADFSLPNSWKCGRCVRFPPADKQPSCSIVAKEEIKDADEPEFDINNVKAEPQESESMQMDTDDLAMETGGGNNTVDAGEDVVIKEEPLGSMAVENSLSQRCDIKTEAADEAREEGEQEEGGRTNLAYKVAYFFQRHAERFRVFHELYQVPAAEEQRLTTLLTERTILVEIFQYLTTFELLTCRSVCKAWQRAARECAAVASSRVDLSGMKVTAYMVQVVAQKKPYHLVLDWTNISKQQVNGFLSLIRHSVFVGDLGFRKHFFLPLRF